MSIMVIGGNGFIGRNLVIRLLRDKQVERVVSMDIAPPKESFMRAINEYTDRFHFVRGDVSQLEDLVMAMKSFNVEKVVNFAYLMVRETEEMPRIAAKVNVLGMCNVFEAARLLGISRVIYNSSNAVYGDQSLYGDKEVTEDDPVYSTYPYGITKILNEMHAAKYSEQYGINIIGLRPAFGSGHGREAAGAKERFTDMADQTNCLS